MFEAQLLRANANSSTLVYSPWMPRGADSAILTVDLVALDSGSKVTVEVFHKNSEDTGDGTLFSGVSAVRNSKGRTSSTWAGLKELVRYRFTCNSELEDTASWILFRMLPPVWFDSVVA